MVAVPVSGYAFVIPLPYGEGADWLTNVLASGEAAIEAKGGTYDVVRPEVIEVLSRNVRPLHGERVMAIATPCPQACRSTTASSDTRFGRPRGPDGKLTRRTSPFTHSRKLILRILHVMDRMLGGDLVH